MRSRCRCDSKNLPVLLTKLLAYLATENYALKQQIGHWLAKTVKS